MTRRRAIRIGALAAIVAATAAAWAVLAPPELGGSTRYVILSGVSMEPSLSAGDLALVRAQEPVEQGDIVLYEDTRLGAHVLHRIVRISGGRLVLKGDNNDFLDGVQPSRREVKGKLWVALPGVGSAIVWAREPLHAGLIVFFLAFFALGGGAAISALRRRSRPQGHERVASDRAPASHGPSGFAQTLLAIGLGGLAVFGLLALVSHSRAETRPQSIADAYAHVGTFSYGAEVEPSDVYPDGLVESGEAVFTNLVPALGVGFTYRLRAEDASAVRGTTELTAVLSDGQGWSREFPLVEPVEFAGRATSVAGTLDVDELTSTVEEMKALTGSGTSTFDLRIDALVDVKGDVADEPIAQGFSPSLRLLLDTVSIHPESSAGSSFTVRKAEPATVDVAASIALGGLRLSVERARRVALAGVLLAALLAAVAGAFVWRSRAGGEPSQIASLFGDRLITISRPPSVSPARVTELSDAESLYRLAELHQRIVLYWREGRHHVYEVDDGGVVYRYRVGLGVERGLGAAADEEVTLDLPPAKLPPRAATG